MFGNRVEKVKADYERAEREFGSFLEKEYGEKDPWSDFIQDLSEVCLGDAEYEELVMANPEDTMSDEVDLIEREKQLIESKGSESLKKAHKLYRKILAAKLKYYMVSGKDWLRAGWDLEEDNEKLASMRMDVVGRELDDLDDKRDPE